MKRLKRGLSFIMACIMLVSNMNIGVYATELSEEIEPEGVVVQEELASEGELLVQDELVNEEETFEDYPDVVELQMEKVSLEDIVEEIYDADELIAIAEESPAMMSEIYFSEWNAYSSYYVYNRLSDVEKKLWNAMEILYTSYLEGEEDLSTGYTDYVVVNATGMTYDDVGNFLTIFKYTHPQYYFLYISTRCWIDANSISVSYGVYDAFKDGTDRKNATNSIKAQLDEWYEEVDLCTTEEEKVEVIHDQVCIKVKYNYDAYNTGIIFVEQSEFTQSAYSVFCMDRTVCAGYAQAFQMMCNGAGIDTIAVTSEDHAWNKVRVNDSWYNVDCTWDDTNAYRWYLRNDANFDTDESHFEEEYWEAYLPLCTLDSGSRYGAIGTLPEITQKVEDPSINITRSETYYTVEITTATEGANIYYTLDGTRPSEAATKSYRYTGPFNINKDANIRAIATCNEYLDSEVVESGVLEHIYYIVDSGSCSDTITWKLDSKGCLFLEGVGEMPSYTNAAEQPWAAYQTDIVDIKIDAEITAIGDYAFYGFYNLTEFSIPKTISKIGAYAFYATGIIELVIPGNVINIGKQAFANCSGLVEVTIEGNIDKLGIGIFYKCTSLKQANLSDSMKTIGEEMFRYCQSLAGIVLPSELTTIEDYAFRDCIKIKEVVIPSGVTKIGYYVFQGCTGLERAEVYASLETHDGGLFYDCSALHSLILPDDMSCIPYNFLNGCSSITEFKIPETVTSINNYSFTRCEGLTEITIPDAVTKIGENAFYGCTGLTKVTISDSVKTIREDAFTECTNLLRIFIPKTVETLEAGAFDVTTAIMGYSDSAAYTYAVENGNEFIDIEENGLLVQFVAGTEEDVIAQYYLKNEQIVEPVLADRVGYTFEGWYTSSEICDETTKWDFENDVVTEAVILYAKWTANTYNLSYNLNYEGAETLASKTVEFDAVYGELPVPEREGYTFEGWYTSASGGEKMTATTTYKTAGDTTLYAHWTPKTYSVTFDANGGTVDITNKSLAYDAVYGELPVPTRTGYTFMGWYTAIEGGDKVSDTTVVKLTEAQTLYAHWTVNTYEVTFDANGGTAEVPKRNITFGEVYGELPVLEREGFTFMGWKLEDGTVVTAESVLSVAENHTLYASWQGKTYVVIFEVKKGTIATSSITVQFDTKYGELPVPTLKGYTFANWYTAEEDGVLVTSDSIVAIADNHILYATYEPNDYKVIFNANGGMVETAEKMVTYDAVYGELPIPTRTGYSFAGWYTTEEGGIKINDTTAVEITDTQTLYAHWAANEYEVSFDATGGTIETEKISVIFDTAYGELPVPEKDNYNFAGWETEDGTVVTAESIVKIPANHKLYATWKGKPYVIIFEVKKGTIATKSMTVYYGSKYGELPVPTLKGYTFDNWYTAEEDGVLITSESVVDIADNHILYAAYEPNQYRVIFDAKGGTVENTEKTVTYDAVYGELPVPTRTGYTFDGWYTEVEGGSQVINTTTVAILENQILYAHWTANTYEVTFGLAGGTGEMDPIEVTFDSVYGELPIPTRTGYTFMGWSREDGVSVLPETQVILAKKHMLTAQWQANSYEVTFEIQNGTMDTTVMNVTYDSKYGELPVPTRTGYTFVNWYTAEEDGILITAESLVDTAENHTLYALYVPNDYKVMFDANSGTMDATEKTVTYDAVYGELPVPEKTGYTFTGWYTQAEGGSLVDSRTLVQITDAQTLYAHWTANEYQVLFDAADGSIETDKMTVKYDAAYGELPVPVKKGYSFNGWKLEDGTAVTAESLVSLTADHTLYAQWSVNTYKIILDAREGSVEITSLEVEYGSAYGELPTPTAEVAFLGWYTIDGALVTSDTIMNEDSDHTLYAHWDFKYTVEKPVANIPDGSELEVGTRVSLTTQTNGAQIYYTMDASIGMDVSEKNGTLYDDAVVITENVTIYAIAVKEGYGNSQILIVSYTVKDESLDWGDITEADRTEQGFVTTEDIPKDLWVAGVLDCDYTGKAVTYPELHVYHHKTLLQEKVDYTVKYKNNKNAGTATITITGKGNYAGSIVKNFEIKPLDLSSAVIPDVTLQYNKKVQKATTKITYELDGKVLILKSGKDFIYTYPGTDKNAADYDADAFKEPGTYTVVLTGKGNYATDEQNPVTFDVTIESKTLISKVSLTKIPNQKYTGSAITPEITLKHSGKELEEGVHYIISGYANNVEVGTASIMIDGIGDYAGSRTITFKITGTPLSKAKISDFEPYLQWAGEEIEQLTELTYGEETLVEGKDYTVEYQNNISVGTATVLYKGMGGYTGTVKKTFKIIGYPISKAIVSGINPVIYYDGGEDTLTDFELNYYHEDGEERYEFPLILDTDGTGDYKVSFKNTGKAGTATIIFTGVNGYTGTLKKTYKIEAYDISAKDARISVSAIDTQDYLKGGVMPKPVVKYTTTDGEELTLVEGKDYTLKYSNNKAVADKTAAKAPTVTITGKGNFKGKLTRTFEIAGSNLTATTMTAGDVVYQKKANICKPIIALYDADGKKLAAGTDYDRKVTYIYAKDVEVIQIVNRQEVTVMRSQGDVVEKLDIIPVGAEIIATVTGIKNYAGTESMPSTQSVTFRYVAANIAKATVKVAAQNYTGKAIELDKDDITIKLGKTTLAKTDYEIVSYSNNVKKGTAKVTIRGIGNYGGEKTVTYKINSKTMNYTIIYDKNAEDATGKMKVSSITAGKKLTTNAYKRDGYKFLGWNTKADGSGQAYADKQVFEIKEQNQKGFLWIFGRYVTLYAQWGDEN